MDLSHSQAFRFIDTHCHFDFPPFSETVLESLIQAKNSGVSHLIVPAVSAARFQGVLTLAKDHTAIFAALGLHPIYTHQPSDLVQLAHDLETERPHIVAVGEIGLDNVAAPIELAAQIDLLKAQCALANRYDLPVILHARGTHDTLAHFLKHHPVARTGVVHGFSGSLTQANRFIQLGYAIGVGGVITYSRAQKTRRTIAELPLTSLVLETDSPDMPIAGYQGQANRPERLVDIFAALCALRPESPETIAAQLFINSQQLFQRSFD